MEITDSGNNREKWAIIALNLKGFHWISVTEMTKILAAVGELGWCRGTGGTMVQAKLLRISQKFVLNLWYPIMYCVITVLWGFVIILLCFGLFSYLLKRSDQNF